MCTFTCWCWTAFIVVTVRVVSCSSRSRPRARLRFSNWCSGSPRGSAARVGRALERAGLITRDIESGYLAVDPGEDTTAYALSRRELDAVLGPGLDATTAVDTGPCLRG